ncbi:hypothetical protein AB1Y20_000181 [Prymnesium parvum]|uniref:Uncharacterized protein n=1 Tax=Prymnesium parvum TaxID=97485 RepID=A0AB34K891_PRYPA
MPTQLAASPLRRICRAAAPPLTREEARGAGTRACTWSPCTKVITVIARERSSHSPTSKPWNSEEMACGRERRVGAVSDGGREGLLRVTCTLRSASAASAERSIAPPPAGEAEGAVDIT